MTSNGASPGPLGGLDVLDLTRLLPGGYATLVLADLGANVVKIEEPGRGDYARWWPPMVGDFSAAHIALNRNKRSMTLNLKKDGGRELLLGLVPGFDVVVESFRPGVMSRLGVGYDELRAVNPDLIYCAITGYGQEGPRAQSAGHDINYIGYGGVLGMTGDEGGPPILPAGQVGDLAGGGMSAVISILTALHKRSTTGEGSFCDVSMLDGVVSWLTLHAAAFIGAGELPERGAMRLSGGSPCYRVYPTADGWLSVGALEPQFWRSLCDALERPDLVDDAFAPEPRRSEVIASLEETFRARTRAEWLDLLDGLDVCVGPVNDLGEALTDAQVRARGMVFDHPVPGVGDWTHLGDPIKIDGSTASVRRPPPQLGEHTDEVLATMGLSTDDIAALHANGVV